MKIIANTLNMSREEWLMLRKNGIGGSDAGAICGLNKYRSPIDVYLDKTSTTIEDKDSEAMRVGRDLEDYVAKRFTEETGKKVHRRNAIMAHDEHDFMLANVDRMVVGENALLECKTANAYMADAWKDGCPESYEIQCHHYMAVTGAEKVYLACLIMGIDFVIREIDRDEGIINDLIRIEEQFWTNNVLAHRMPPPDGSNAATDAIRNMYLASKPKALELDHLSGRMLRYADIETLIGTLSTEKELIKQEIMLTMGEADTAFIGGCKVTWKTQKGRVTIDSKRLKADLPEIYAAYSKESAPSRPFKVFR